jgi:hypothetical protein
MSPILHEVHVLSFTDEVHVLSFVLSFTKCMSYPSTSPTKCMSLSVAKVIDVNSAIPEQDR